MSRGSTAVLRMRALQRHCSRKAVLGGDNDHCPPSHSLHGAGVQKVGGITCARTHTRADCWCAHQQPCSLWKGRLALYTTMRRAQGAHTEIDSAILSVQCTRLPCPRGPHYLAICIAGNGGCLPAHRHVHQGGDTNSKRYARVHGVACQVHASRHSGSAWCCCRVLGTQYMHERCIAVEPGEGVAWPMRQLLGGQTRAIACTRRSEQGPPRGTSHKDESQPIIPFYSRMQAVSVAGALGIPAPLHEGIRVAALNAQQGVQRSQAVCKVGLAHSFVLVFLIAAQDSRRLP